MTVRAKLKDLAPGTVFNAGPIDVRVLEHFADGRTLLIADTCIADRHFADQPFKTRPEKPAANPNDWRFSNLNRELNTPGYIRPGRRPYPFKGHLDGRLVPG